MGGGDVLGGGDGPADGGAAAAAGRPADLKWDYLDAWRADLACGGHVMWRRGTGGNFELLELRATLARQGQGRRLVAAMLRAMAANPPYATVFGFTRLANLDAQAFYRAMGFTLSAVAGVYADGSAILFSARYRDLCDLHLTPKETHAESREADAQAEGAG